MAISPARRPAALFLSLIFIICSFLTVKGAYAEDAGMEFGVGHRVDNLRWDIAGNTGGTNPNILSELKWQDLQITEFRLKAEKNIRPVYLKGSFGYGAVYNGANQDSDFNGDNRTLEFSRSNNRSDSGSVWDASLGLGYRSSYLISPDGSGVTPLLGYSFHKQNLKITDGFQTIATPGRTPPLGPFPGLDSSYESLWQGPWAGADLAYKIGVLTLLGSIEYHFAASYKADANWNLRPDFNHPISFEHSAIGTGLKGSVGADYSINNQLSLKGYFDMERWKTGSGTDMTFFADGTSAVTRLNEVVWDSYSIMLGIKYVFSSF